MILDALAERFAEDDSEESIPTASVVLCIDERMESLRRHIEELRPDVQTYGTAGFFGIAMYYKGLDDAVPAPLCPITIVPDHEVHELPAAGQSVFFRRRSAQRKLRGQFAHGASVGSRTFVRGTIWASAIGLWSAIPLVARVLVPRMSARVGKAIGDAALSQVDTRLALEGGEPHPSTGRRHGFQVDEMADIVARVLEEMGLVGRLPRLVLIVGHGSASLNNPHESAHDCGACGGGHGGPNARAFAEMANHAMVRERLSTRGIEIPIETAFVGAHYDTCSCSLKVFDADRVPASHRDELHDLESSLANARELDAQERCRRFDNAPPNLTPAAALRHVEGRAEDLAQPRPEYGHATNAVCIIGRRARTRRLYLDRRAFLVSYDPTQDPDGQVLARIFESAGSVCAGINLEYYFSFVDPVRYGCGTKLPHNITGLLGVMDGHSSDLRTGLPWQMVEIHEPVRLLCIVEATPARLESVIETSESMRRLVKNSWVRLVAADPDSETLWIRGRSGFERHVCQEPRLPRAASSHEWYRGKRDHLAPAIIDGPAA